MSCREGDGYSDILWRANDGTMTDWLGQANGAFTDNSATASQPLNTGFTIAGVGDFNGDHKSDMLLEWSDGSLHVWTGSGSGAIQSPAEKVWWDAFVGTQALMADMTTAVINASVQSGHSMPTPQVDYMTGEQAAAAADMWYMSNPSKWPDRDQSVDPVWAQNVADLMNYLATASSSVLQIDAFGSGGFSASFGSDRASLIPIDEANSIFFNFNGSDFIPRRRAHDN